MTCRAAHHRDPAQAVVATADGHGDWVALACSTTGLRVLRLTGVGGRRMGPALAAVTAIEDQDADLVVTAIDSFAPEEMTASAVELFLAIIASASHDPGRAGTSQPFDAAVAMHLAAAAMRELSARDQPVPPEHIRAVSADMCVALLSGAARRRTVVVHDIGVVNLLALVHALVAAVARTAGVSPRDQFKAYRSLVSVFALDAQRASGPPSAETGRTNTESADDHPPR